jgi:hypothetical protein
LWPPPLELFTGSDPAGSNVVKRLFSRRFLSQGMTDEDCDLPLYESQMATD